MRRAILFTVLAFGLGACANAVETGPSFLGMHPAEAHDTDEPQSPPPATALRKVKSTKVLGAMAFERVTKRPVDPARLAGE